MSRRRPRSSVYAKRDRFMFLSCRAWQRKVQRCITHVQALPLSLSLKVLSGDVLVANGPQKYGSTNATRARGLSERYNKSLEFLFFQSILA